MALFISLYDAKTRLSALVDRAIVPIDAEDAGHLEWGHNDPFDRLLVAQAMRLGFVLLTADQSIRSFEGVALLPAH